MQVMKKGLLKFSWVTLFIFVVIAAKSQSSLFVRVFDMNGNKIGKGTIANITDSSIQLSKSDHYILAKNIGAIRTKRSFGHNVLVSTIVTTGIFVTVMAIGSSDKGGLLSWTLMDGIGVGFIAGAIYGPPIGAFTTLFKNTMTFPINGSEKNLKDFYQYAKTYK
jgi:hypothetical protein